MSFYINCYVIGYLDEFCMVDEFVDVLWIWSLIFKDVMVVFGLVGLLNLRGDVELMMIV